MDTACACLMRLAAAVHGQGYKVALTGEGADEALAGYAWFKSQKIRNIVAARHEPARPQGSCEGVPARRSSAATPPAGRTGRRCGGSAPPSRTCTTSSASRDRSSTPPRCGNASATTSAYDDLDLTNDRFGRWSPLNQSLYVGYKVMLAGPPAARQGGPGRDALVGRDAVSPAGRRRHHASARASRPSTSCEGLTDKWLLRQVAARTLPKAIANRPKTMFRASRGEAFLGPHRPGVGRSAPEPRIARGPRAISTPTSVALERAVHARSTWLSPKKAGARPEPDVRRLDPALAPPLRRRGPLRPRLVGTARLAPSPAPLALAPDAG